jgi:predicted phosphodiesterase
MTRLAVLADIHGNLPALEAVIDDMKSYAPDHVVVAGDIVNWGPFSAEVTEIVTTQRWTLIRGNNAFYLMDAAPPRKPETWVSYTMLGWLKRQLTDWQYIIAGWPDDVVIRVPDAPDIHMFHGLPGNPWQGICSAPYHTDEQVRELLADAKAHTVICGHTHFALNRHVDNLHIINPGSVGVPLDGKPGASYMILDGDWDGWRVSVHRRVPFDLSPVFERFEDMGFVEECGPTALLVLEEFRQYGALMGGFAHWHQDHYPGQPQTFDHAREYAAGDPRPYLPEPYRAAFDR